MVPGLSGDGITDDTAAFAAALAACPAGGRIEIPPGTYLIDGPSLRVPSRVTIAGAGSATVLRRTVATSPLFVFPAGGKATEVRFTRLAFSGGGFDAASAANGAAIRSEESGVQGLTIEHCSFDGWTYAILAEAGSDQIIAEQNSSTRCSGAFFCADNGVGHAVNRNRIDGDRTGIGDGARMRVGIWFGDRGDGSPAGQGHEARGNTVSRVKNEGIIVRTAHTTIADNQVSDCDDGAGGSYGIIVEGTGDTVHQGEFGLGAGNFARVAGNTVVGCNGGIRVSFDPAGPNSTPRDCLVEGNVIMDITGPSQKGIAIGWAEMGPSIRPIVRNNKILNAAVPGNGDGILLRHVIGGVIEGNVVHTASRYGIVVDHATTGTDLSMDTTIAGNTIHQARDAGIFVWPRGGHQVKRLSITDNSIYMAGQPRPGIAFHPTLDGSSDCVVARNVVHASAPFGLVLSGTNLTSLGNVSVGTTAGNVEFIGNYSLNPAQPRE